MQNMVIDVADLKHIYETYMQIKRNKVNQDYVIVGEVKSYEESITADDTRKNRNS